MEGMEAGGGLGVNKTDSTMEYLNLFVGFFCV